MTNMDLRETKRLYWAASFLLAGSAVYIVFRPTSLLMFHWIDAVGLIGPIQALRTPFSAAADSLPAWFIYSVPFALWVLSYLLFVKLIWWQSPSPWRYFYFWCVPLISIASEICQYLRVIPGTFDLHDLLMLGLATAFALSSHAFSHLTTRGHQNEQ